MNSTITWPNPPLLSQHTCPSLGTSGVFKEEEKFQTWYLHWAWGKVGNLNLEDLQSPQMCLLPSNKNIFNACSCSGSFNIFLLSAASSHSLLSFPSAVQVIWCAAASKWQCVLSDWQASTVSILSPLTEVSVCSIDLVLVHAALLSLLSSPQVSHIMSPLDTTKSILENNPPCLWLYHGLFSCPDSLGTVVARATGQMTRSQGRFGKVEDKREKN